jgi:lysozyme family protein
VPVLADFKRALKSTLGHEGGYSNHPSDPGGVTLEGVIQRVYDAYRRLKGLPLRPLTAAMRNTPEWIAERDDIYRRQYWDRNRCGEMPAGVGLVVFDATVNSGAYQAALWLQRALGKHYTGQIDGDIGAGTLRAIWEHPDHDRLIADICARRLGMLQNLKTWPTFGKGWSRRVASVLQIGQAWASGTVGPQPVYDPAGVAKAYASDVAQPPVSEEVAQTATYSGGTIAVALQGARETLQPLVGTSDLVNNIYLGIVIGAAAAAVGGAILGVWAARKNRKARAAIDGRLIGDVDLTTLARAA